MDNTVRKRKAVAAILVLSILEDDEDIKKRRGNTRGWIKRRNERGFFCNLWKELSLEDTETFKRMMRMSHQTFTKLLNLVEEDITPNERPSGTRPIPAAERLTILIRYLATGMTFADLSYEFRVSERAVSYIISEVAHAIIKNLGDTYVRPPLSETEWKNVATEFNGRWNFPHCIGAIDGKHVVIEPPPNTGSEYHNYKKSFSIILLAIVGPDYECIFADVGSNGRMNDSGVWNTSDMKKRIEEKRMNIPKDAPLQEGCVNVPYTFVGDDAFALKTYMMKPYAQKKLDDKKSIFNYRLSRARRISENFFGILVNRFRIFRQPINVGQSKAKLIVLSAIALHNFLRKGESRYIYSPTTYVDSPLANGEVIDGTWRKEPMANNMFPLEPSKDNNPTLSAKTVRDIFAEHFFSDAGSVSWQWNRI